MAEKNMVQSEHSAPPMPAIDATLRVEKIKTHKYRPLYRITQVVWFVLGVMEILLLFRFFLKLFGANPSAGFTRFIYGASELCAGPFLRVFRVSQVQGAQFEWSTLLAAVTYWLVAWLIVKATVMSKPVTTEEAEQKLPEQEKL